ncbi:hypothetical protein [Herminiimonas sp. CN]|uniref:hypothetical protein n=1 Tax=Herminiimonas sp. CN TaxID=1349818 RepID=UPI00047365BB|nr:hypothetical protein [Herminiimonas sp. CN]
MGTATTVLARDSRPGLLWLIIGGWMLQPLSTDLYLASLPHLSTYPRLQPQRNHEIQGEEKWNR